MSIAFGFLLYNSTIVPSLLLAAFLVTFGVYGLNKVTDQAEDSINKPEWTTRRTDYYLKFSITTMIAGLLIGLFEGLLAFVFLAMPLLIGILYSITISKTIPRLKEITGVKNLVVAISWGLPSCFLPAGLNFDPVKTTVIFCFIFTRVFVGSVLFDVLDAKGDGASGVQTIPVKVGLTQTKKILFMLNSLSLLLPVWCLWSGVLANFVPVFIFGVVYGYLAIWLFYSSQCSRLAAGLMLDAEWLPIVLIAGLFFN